MEIKRGRETVHLGRIWTVGDISIAIVAVEGEFSWAAYVGWSFHFGDLSSKQVALHVADHGKKLSKEDAKHYFPQVKGRYNE